jgi:hypothetical protein
VIGASGLPMMGSSSIEILTGADGCFVGNWFCNSFNSNFAIASSRSSSEIWLEFRFDVYDPAKNAVIPTSIITPSGFFNRNFFVIILIHSLVI